MSYCSRFFQPSIKPMSFASFALAGRSLPLCHLCPNIKHDESQSQLVKKVHCSYHEVMEKTVKYDIKKVLSEELELMSPKTLMGLCTI